MSLDEGDPVEWLSINLSEPPLRKKTREKKNAGPMPLHNGEKR